MFLLFSLHLEFAGDPFLGGFWSSFLVIFFGLNSLNLGAKRGAKIVTQRGTRGANYSNWGTILAPLFVPPSLRNLT